jgi:hypothetical protein
MSQRRTVDRDPKDRSMRRLLVGLTVTVAVVVGIYVFFWGGVFRFRPEEGETFWHLLHQKGHWYLEIFISGVETIVFDILVGLVGWRYVLKPYIAHRQAQAIAQDHALHGIEAHVNDVSIGAADQAPTEDDGRSR